MGDHIVILVVVATWRATLLRRGKSDDPSEYSALGTVLWLPCSSTLSQETGEETLSVPWLFPRNRQQRGKERCQSPAARACSNRSSCPRVSVVAQSPFHPLRCNSQRVSKLAQFSLSLIETNKRSVNNKRAPTQEAKNAACDRLLAQREGIKVQSKKAGDISNRLHVAMPKPRDTGQRPSVIPASVLAARSDAAAVRAPSLLTMIGRCMQFTYCSCC